MATYIYETVPDFPDVPVRRFEIKQSMKDAPLTHDPADRSESSQSDCWGNRHHDRRSLVIENHVWNGPLRLLLNQMHISEDQPGLFQEPVKQLT